MSKKYYYKDQKVKGHSRTTPKSQKVIKIDPYDRKQKFRRYSNISNRKAQDLFDNKSQRSKTMDLKTTSNKVFEKPNEKWAENTGRSDVFGIDTKLEIQERFLLYADFIGKKTEDVKPWEYMGFINKVSALYEKQAKPSMHIDQEDFTNFIKEYIKKSKNRKKVTPKSVWKSDKGWESLSNKERSDIKYKVSDDKTVLNIAISIEQIKRAIRTVKRELSKANQRNLPQETKAKINERLKLHQDDLEKAEQQLEKRTETLKKEYTTKLLKLKTHYGMGVEGEIGFADNWKPKQDMTLTENEYALSKLGGSSDKRSYKEYLDDSKIPIEEYGIYYDKKMKMSDKISQPKLKKLKEAILELERKGNRNSRFDVILRNPKEDQKELVEKYRKALKNYTMVHSKDFDFKLQKRFKEIKGLPDLKPDQKYYVVMVRDSGWVDHIGYKKQKEDAVDERVVNEVVFKSLRKDVKGKVEIILAKNIEDVRNQVRSRGRENYLITGDTYKQKSKIRSIARVKFDYGNKGYIGELSPKELEELNKLSGIEIKKIKSLTKEDLERSKVAKAHSKAKKFVRHEKVAGSIWQKENPFTDKQNALEDSLTWIFKIGDDRNRLNTNFQNYVKSKENEITARLRLNKIEDAHPDVLDAVDRYRKEVYNKILSDLNANRIAPSTVITGGSNYRGNMPKRERIERNAYERFKKVDKAVDKVVRQYEQL